MRILTIGLILIFKNLLAQIVEIENLPRNTEVGSGITYKDKSNQYALNLSVSINNNFGETFKESSLFVLVI